MLPTVVLAIGALYCVLPVCWIVVASTKTPGELFSTRTFEPSFSGGFVDNLSELFTYNDGVFGRWVLNTLLFAGVGTTVSVLVSASAGYALAKYRFAGRETVFKLILAGVLIPQIALAIPQYVVEDSFGDVDDGADLGEVVADVVGVELGGVDLRVLGVVSLSAHPVEGSQVLSHRRV